MADDGILLVPSVPCLGQSVYCPALIEECDAVEVLSNKAHEGLLSPRHSLGTDMGGHMFERHTPPFPQRAHRHQVAAMLSFQDTPLCNMPCLASGLGLVFSRMSTP